MEEEREEEKEEESPLPHFDHLTPDRRGNLGVEVLRVIVWVEEGRTWNIRDWNCGRLEE